MEFQLTKRIHDEISTRVFELPALLNFLSASPSHTSSVPRDNVDGLHHHHVRCFGCSCWRAGAITSACSFDDERGARWAVYEIGIEIPSAEALCSASCTDHVARLTSQEPHSPIEAFRAQFVIPKRSKKLRHEDIR